MPGYETRHPNKALTENETRELIPPTKYERRLDDREYFRSRIDLLIQQKRLTPLKWRRRPADKA